jgi:hypothetical protein
LPPEAISDLRRRLFLLTPRSAERRLLVEETARLYGVSTDTLYRALRERAVPKPLRRCDHGLPRVMGAKEMERFCEVVAAIKVRTSNKKGGTSRPPRPSACSRTTACKPLTELCGHRRAPLPRPR